MSVPDTSETDANAVYLNDLIMNEALCIKSAKT